MTAMFRKVFLLECAGSFGSCKQLMQRAIGCWWFYPTLLLCVSPPPVLTYSLYFGSGNASFVQKLPTVVYAQYQSIRGRTS